MEFLGQFSYAFVGWTHSVNSGSLQWTQLMLIAISFPNLGGRPYNKFETTAEVRQHLGDM